jgi:hypothetical protein
MLKVPFLRLLGICKMKLLSFWLQQAIIMTKVIFIDLFKGALPSTMMFGLKDNINISSIKDLVNSFGTSLATQRYISDDTPE